MLTVSRRAVLAGALSLGVTCRAGAHTPYKQWDVYRRKHLLIGTCRADPASYPLGQRLVAEMAETLPESRPRVTRAPDQRRLASLLTTGQLDIVVLSLDEAVRLARGDEPFAEFGPFPVRLLLPVEDHVLISSEDLPERHAWLIVKALSQASASRWKPAAEDAVLPLHAGARAYLAGEPMPD